MVFIQFVLNIDCVCGKVVSPVIFSHIQSYHHSADQDIGVSPPKLLGTLVKAMPIHLFSPSLNSDSHKCNLFKNAV